MLPDEDRNYLEDRFPHFSESIESGMICVVLPGFPTSGRTDTRLRRSPSPTCSRLPRRSSGYVVVRPGSPAE